MKIEHIAIAVSDINSAMKIFRKILDAQETKILDIPDMNVTAVKFNLNNNISIELVQPTSENSTVAKFIKSRGEGIHHICLLVDDIKSFSQHLSSLGFKLLYNEPEKGYDDMLINFLHPKDTCGVLIELAQKSYK